MTMLYTPYGAFIFKRQTLSSLDISPSRNFVNNNSYLLQIKKDVHVLMYRFYLLVF